MKLYLYIYSTFLMLLFFPVENAAAQDSLAFDGQLSAWMHYNPSNTLQFYAGARYIPQLSIGIPFKSKERLIDFEASAKIFGSIGFHAFDTSYSSGNIKPYRLWLRYSTPQFEVRLGLQKINFGSATMLRPLMWFDQIDPRDPLKLTDGVWGLLARYYFLNNANIWLWTLYGNDKRKGWESFTSESKIPEFGGRFQSPLSKGEIAVSYHNRTADLTNIADSMLQKSKVNENRLGFDIKLDVIIGCWLEASWSNYSKNIGTFTNQHIINAGVDYTFGLGSGLTVIYEQLLASYDQNAFEFENTTSFSLLNLSYPLGVFDNVSAIIYYDWTNHNVYNFLNWQKQFNKFSFFVMGYFNPAQYKIPAQGDNESIYAGSGLQIMFVLNH
jgi:hypothetical protein